MRVLHVTHQYPPAIGGSERYIADLSEELLARGHYSIELASRGAQVLGIEGREWWLEQANRNKQNASLSNVEFVQDDVRNLSKEKYGEFDIVLCLWILYHLDVPDVFDFVNKVADVCRDFAIVETHFAVTPTLSYEWRGKRYWGMSTFEHYAGAISEDKLKAVSALLDNEKSFWFTQAYGMLDSLRCMIAAIP